MNAKEIKAAQLQKLKEECENKGISFDSMKRLLESEKVKKLQKRNHYIQQTIIDEIEKANNAFIKHEIDSTRKTIMISLLGSEEIKTYPLEYMAQIVEYIGTNYNVNILFNYFILITRISF